MRIKKLIPYTVDVLDTNDMYTPYKETALKLLREKFKGGVCYSEAFIVDITRIIHIRLPTADKNRNDGRMLIDVIFEAECIIFVKGEIIPDVMINKFVANGNTSIPTGYLGNIDKPIAYVHINKSDGQAYKENNKGPCIVVNAIYPLDQPAVVTAMAFRPIHRKVYLYKCVGGTLTADQIEYLNSRAQYIRDMKKELDELGKGRLEQITYFRKLLYPNTGEPEIPKIKGFDVHNILEVKDWNDQGSSFYAIKPIQLGYASYEYLIATKTDDPSKLLTKYTTIPDAQKEEALAFYDSVFNIIEIELSSLISIMKAYPVKDLTLYKGYFENFKRLKHTT